MTDANESTAVMAEPIAPDSLPKYLREGLPKQDTETLQDVIAYAEALIEYKNRPLVDEDFADESEEIITVDEDREELKGTYVEKMVTCGDETCHCMKEGTLHGPYAYDHYRDETGKSTADYLGPV